MLVRRGYPARAEDLEGRRRLVVTLTPQDKATADAGRSAVDEIDREVAQRVGSGKLGHARASLATLIQIGEEHGAFEPATSDPEP